MAGRGSRGISAAFLRLTVKHGIRTVVTCRFFVAHIEIPRYTEKTLAGNVDFRSYFSQAEKPSDFRKCELFSSE